MPIEKLRPTFTFAEDRLKELQAVVPEAFADGKINWDTLREALGEHLEDENQEHFGLTWPGKREARRLAAMPSKGALVPQPGQGVNEANTHNLFIEGDNLEVLKLLQKSYAGRVKMIYIDPPYNTGNDFIYKDSFTDSLESYLNYTGAKGERGEMLTTNTRADGRFHSKWLNMMYPRLILARQLLRDDGVIFISIGEEEVHNIRLLLAELFGEENYISTIARISKTASDMGTFFAPSIDFILCFSKDKNSTLPFIDKVNEALYKKIEISGSRKGEKFRDDVALYQSSLTLERSRNARYYINCPDGSKCIPPVNKRWRIVESTYLEMKEREEIVFKQTKTSPLLDENGNKSKWNIYTKSYLSDRQGKGTRPRNFEEKFINRKGADYLKTLNIQFDFSKPYQLIQWLISIVGVNENDIVLDFFAGSGSSADALLRLNRNDGCNRRFILVQLPESIINAEFSTIAEICRERIRRVIEKLIFEKDGKLDFYQDEDLGFRCFSLEKSNYKDWQSYKGSNISKLETLFDHFETPLVVGWQPKNLFIEILLLQGFPLDSRVRDLPDFEHNHVQEVTSEFCAHRLYICLDKAIQAKTVTAIKLRAEDVLVCLDSALSDEAKIVLADRCNLKVI